MTHPDASSLAKAFSPSAKVISARLSCTSPRSP
jgi:hypothetical protein